MTATVSNNPKPEKPDRIKPPEKIAQKQESPFAKGLSCFSLPQRSVDDYLSGSMAGFCSGVDRRDEARADRPARDVVVEHLLQVLMIEAFRSTTQPDATSGLLSGLSDARIGPTLRAMHAAPDHNWTVPKLANVAGLSRSAFFTRFSRIVRMTPIGYLLNWRMTLAKHMLRSGRHGIAEVSGRIGYGSVSAFSTAFARYVGYAPARYAKAAVPE